jgi:hypothetical protein
MATTKQTDGTEVASESQNAKLEHSRGGVTTRDDATDLGVPMLPGDPSEPVGPEDALGESPTRGDYRSRIGDVRPRSVEPIPDAKPGEPQVRVVDQSRNAENIGDLKGKKGGVDTE